jgi:hypothetical protein
VSVGVLAVATAVVNGRPVAVTGGMDLSMRVWDLTTCEQVEPPLAFPFPVGTLGAAPDGRGVRADGVVGETCVDADRLTPAPRGDGHPDR